MQADKPGLPVLVFFLLLINFLWKRKILWEMMGQFSHRLFRYKQRMASLFFFFFFFFCLQHNTLLPHQHNFFLYYHYYYGDTERQEYNIHRLCQVQQITYMNSQLHTRGYDLGQISYFIPKGYRFLSHSLFNAPHSLHPRSCRTWNIFSQIFPEVICFPRQWRQAEVDSL